MPTVSPAQYLVNKSALAPFVQSNFAFPPRVEVTPPPVIPRAPAASVPIVTAPTVSFEGIPFTTLTPPSPDIAVGPSDVLMVVNSSIAHYSRTGTLKKTSTFAEWFVPVYTTVCPAGPGQCLIYDPWIRYDQLHGRFLFLATARDFRNRLSYLLLSVSEGATFDSGWKIWALDARLDGTSMTVNWADFWRLGFDNAAVYLSGNMYSQGGSFQYGKIRVLKKSELYNTATTTLTFKDLWNLKNEDNTTASSLLAVHPRGKPAAANTGLFVNASDAVPSTKLTVWKITDPLADTLAVTRSTITGLLPYYYPAPAPQAGGPGTLDSGDSRVLKAVYRDGFIYTARDAGYVDQTTTIAFEVIDTSTMTASSQSRLRNANTFYPAFDVPATTAPGAPFATDNIIAGTTTAPDGTLMFAGISKLKAGEAYYNAGTPSRWGDYFGGTVDPLTGGLWVSGEYAKPQFTGGFAQWGTWAGYFPWTTTETFSDVPGSSIFSDYINVLSLWQITSGCLIAPARFCPANQVTRAQMAVFIIRSMFGNTFTYTTTPYFTDVPSSDVFFPYVQKMRDLGITAGCRATAFCPDDPVTRMAAAVFLVRAKLKALHGETFPYPTQAYFTDVGSGSPEFPYIQKLHELGITSGCAVGLFCPNTVVTREQAAVFLVRAFLN
jgi:hypothetical protein